MKKLKKWQHEKEFDTQTIFTSIDSEAVEATASRDERLTDSTSETEVSDDTDNAVNLRDLAKVQKQDANERKTQTYSPRPLTPNDEIYEDILEQFATAPTKPKYWFEEFGDYWSCSCGHINKGEICKSCGLERSLLRSLFILHKPANEPGKLNKKLKKAKEQIDKEESLHEAKEKRQKNANNDINNIQPIEDSHFTDESFVEKAKLDNTEPKDVTAKEVTGSGPSLVESAIVDSVVTHQEDEDETEPAENHLQNELKQPESRLNNELTLPEKQQQNNLVPLETQLQNKIGQSEKQQKNKIAQLLKQQKDKIKLFFTEVKDKRSRSADKPPTGSQPAGKKSIGSKKKHIIIASTIIAIFLVLGGVAAYVYLAAPAMQYDQAQQLQADGDYEKAIAKYKALGDYKDCKDKIWECRIGIGDDYYKEGEFEKALDAYNTAFEIKESDKLYEKIRSCYIGIGDKHYDNKEYESALSSYSTASDMNDSEELDGKINKAKFAYVKAYQSKRTAKVEQYMSQLMNINYPGIRDIYDAYYAWKVKIIANTSEDDFSTDVETVSRKDTIYFHAALSGGEPDEQIELYYEVTWPNGPSQIYALDSKWKSGSNITARFQYPMPLFGNEGTLTFKLYDKSTNQVMATDSVTLQK